MSIFSEKISKNRTVERSKHVSKLDLLGWCDMHFWPRYSWQYFTYGEDTIVWTVRIFFLNAMILLYVVRKSLTNWNE